MKRATGRKIKTSSYEREHYASAVQMWMDEQPYDVIKAARNPRTPVHTLLDIARHGDVETRHLLANNKSATAEILSNLVSKKPSEVMMNLIANNPNASSSALNKLAFMSKSQNTLSRILSHKNLSLMLASRYLATAKDYNYDGPSYYMSHAMVAAANPVVPFDVLLKHISYYREDEINYIVGNRSKEFKKLIKPYRPNPKDSVSAMGKLINVTLFDTTDDAEIISDWYGQLLDANEGNPHALTQLKESAAKFL